MSCPSCNQPTVVLRGVCALRRYFSYRPDFGIYCEIAEKMSLSSCCNGAEILCCQELDCELGFPDVDLNGSVAPTPESTLKAGLDANTRKKYMYAKKKVRDCNLCIHGIRMNGESFFYM